MSSAHSEIPLPLLDMSRAQRDKPAFIAQLREMLVNRGFIYLEKTPVPTEVIDKMVDSTTKFFALPTEAKKACDMNHTAHFNGYLCKGPVENPTREQFNYGDDNADPLEGTPVYHKIHGTTPWPDDTLFPGCRAAMREYYNHLKNLSSQFTEYVAEALGLESDGFEPLFEQDVSRRFVTHTDANFLTYLLQASSEPGLEFLKPSGEWLPATPIPGTFIVLVGDVLEKVTQGLVKAPVHHVVSPTQGTRYSVGFFQGVAMDTRIAEMKFEFPQEIVDMKRARQQREGDTTEYTITENDRMPAGQVVLNFKLKAHPLVAYKFYPTLFPKFYPNGLPERYASLVH